MKVIIIGGVAAGMSAASKIKRTQFDADVVVYEKGTVLSYGACGMPYLVSNVIEDPKKLIARSKEDFEKMGMTIHLQHEVVDVDANQKTVTVKDLVNNQTITDTYDKLLVATGASPIVPPIKGIDLPGIETLSTYDDGVKLKELFATRNDIKNVVIIGAGFIGVEMAEAMLEMDKNVTMVEFKNQILPNFDKDIVYPLQEELISKGVHLKLSEKVTEFKGNGKVEQVCTDTNCYQADIVILSVGIRPNTGFLKNTDVEMLRNGAVLVNKKMESSVADIYSAGDCASIYHRVKDSFDNYIPLGTNANKQGRVVGEVICGMNSKFDGAMGTSMVKVADMEAAKAGLSEREAIEGGFEYKAVTIKSRNHAGYYPNPQRIIIKLVYDPKTYKILGAQIVGYKDAALRINVFALAIHAGVPTYELGMVDFGYAPPFAGVWDAIHIAANQAK